jgi:hypothetical protein
VEEKVMASTELVKQVRRFAEVWGVVRNANFMIGKKNVLAVDVVKALDELVRDGFLVGPIALPREGIYGPTTIKVYVLKELYPTLTDIWQRHGVMYGGEG